MIHQEGGPTRMIKVGQIRLTESIRVLKESFGKERFLDWVRMRRGQTITPQAPGWHPVRSHTVKATL